MTTVLESTESRPTALSPNQRFEAAFREIVSLKARRISRSRFYREALDCIAGCTGALFAVLEVREASEVIEHQYQREGAETEFWGPTVDSCLTQALKECAPRLRRLRKRSNIPVVLLSAPFLDDTGKPVGAVAMVASSQDATQASRMLSRLHSLMLLCTRSAGQDESAGSSAPRTDAGLGAVAKSVQYSSGTELAFALTNNLCNKTRCDQVALGMVRGRQVKVVSISGLDDVGKRNPGVLHIQHAMEECLDSGETLVCQNEAHGQGKAGPRHRLHRRWHEECKGAAVASIPLFAGSECIAVLSLRRRGDEPYSSAQLEEYRNLVEPYAAALELVDHAKRGLLAHAVASGRSRMRQLLGPRDWMVKLWFTIAALGLGWVVFGDIGYQVTVPGVLVPTKVRHFGAPTDGTIAQVFFKAGDRVSKGDILCAFDPAQLELELRTVEAEQAIAEIQARRSLATGSAVESQLAEAQRHRLAVRRGVLERQLEELVVRAPFDGVVLSGDLQARIGDRFQEGEPLFELSPAEGWKLELKVPQSEVGELSENLPGVFCSYARPDEPHSIQILRVWPHAQAENGENVFLAESAIQIEADWIRSGMEGVAQIDVGARPVWWVLAHRTLNALRLNFWL